MQSRCNCSTHMYVVKFVTTDWRSPKVALIVRSGYNSYCRRIFGHLNSSLVRDHQWKFV